MSVIFRFALVLVICISSGCKSIPPTLQGRLCLNPALYDQMIASLDEALAEFGMEKGFSDMEDLLERPVLLVFYAPKADSWPPLVLSDVKVVGAVDVWIFHQKFKSADEYNKFLKVVTGRLRRFGSLELTTYPVEAPCPAN
ncbi:MAG: hypothetical protein JHC82_01710 [Stenotrophomonas sp.]|nr:hypothetical protein [Stenotrophomonas sp.]